LLACGVVALFGVAGLGACAVVGVAAIAARSQATTADDAACSPQPCANAGGFVAFVDRVEWRIAAAPVFQPEAGNQFARVTVRFANHAAGERHADPFQFVLRDGGGVKHALAFAGDGWQAVNLAPGAAFGPRSLDFQVGQGTTTGALVWTPDLRDHQIPLR
jgi:hypothetical protein